MLIKAAPYTSSDTSIGSGQDRLRVLHVNSGNLYGGVETLLVTLARLRHLCEGMEPQFALCHEGRLSRELLAAGVAVHQLGKVRISRPWTVWRARRRLRELLSEEQFDLVICHMPWSLVVFGDTVRRAGQTLGFWAHSQHTGRGWLERLARGVKPDLAISNSRYTEAGMAGLFPEVAREVVYPPIELSPPTQTEQWRSTVRQQQGVSADDVVIIQVSRLEAWKGHTLHLQALSLLKDVEGWVCWFVGGPQKPDEKAYLRALEKTAAELGITDRVQFLGQRSDVPRLLAAADIFCQPNLKPEPFGIVYVESLWANRPVVTTDMGGAAEIIDSSCGLLVKGENPASLAESLLRLIQSPELRGRLGKAGAARAHQLCDPAAQMKKLRDLAQTTLSIGGRVRTL
jgi:glycosyltransferase involved in cell wall biosynthesis